jgi:hypothetical protein
VLAEAIVRDLPNFDSGSTIAHTALQKLAEG